MEELGFRNSSLGEYNELAELDKSLGSKSKVFAAQRKE